MAKKKQTPSTLSTFFSNSEYFTSTFTHYEVPRYGFVNLKDPESVLAYGKYLAENSHTYYTDPQEFRDVVMEGRKILTLPPAQGKSTAVSLTIAQFANTANPVTCVWAFRKIEDLERNYVNLVARTLYLHHDEGMTLEKALMVARPYHSNTPMPERNAFKEFAKYQVILTTEYQVMHECHELLGFYKNTPREHIVYDELPNITQKQHGTYEFHKVLEALKYLVSSELSSYLLKAKIIPDRKELKDKIDNETSKSMVESVFKYLAKTPTNHLQDMVRKAKHYNVGPRILLDLKDELSKIVPHTNDPKLYFARVSEYFFDNLDRLNQVSDPERSKLFFTYNLIDSPCKNILILDGTGDLMSDNLKDFGGFEVIAPMARQTKIIQCEMVPFSVKRRRSLQDDAVKNCLNFIGRCVTETNKKTPGGKVLIEMWKTLQPSEQANTLAKARSEQEDKGKAKLAEIQADNFLHIVQEKVKELYHGQVTIITYGSGCERSSNDYKDCCSIGYMGVYFIPNYAANSLGEGLGIKTNSYRYTLAGAVQAFFRTCARDNKPVQVFFSSDHSMEFVQDFLDCCNSQCEITGNATVVSCPTLYVPTKVGKILNALIENQGKIDSEDLGKIFTHHYTFKELQEKVMGGIFKSYLITPEGGKSTFGEELFFTKIHFTPGTRGRYGKKSTIEIDPDLLQKLQSYQILISPELDLTNVEKQRKFRQNMATANYLLGGSEITEAAAQQLTDWGKGEIVKQVAPSIAEDLAYLQDPKARAKIFSVLDHNQKVYANNRQYLSKQSADYYLEAVS